MAVGRARRGVPEGGGPGRHDLALDAQRRDDAGAEQDRVSIRDRRGLRGHRLLALQPVLRAEDLRGAAHLGQGDVEPARLPRPRGLRLRHHAVQLHRHRRQPAHRAGPDGLLGRMEAGIVGHAQRVLPVSPAGGGGPAAGRHQHGVGRRRDDFRAPARPSRAGGSALHRQHHRLQLDVEDHRRVDEHLPQLPPHRRGDRRQGLHRRARLGRRGPGGRRDRPRGLRVPGAEVLGGQPRLRAQGDVAGAARSRGRDDRRDPDGRRRATSATSWAR